MMQAKPTKFVAYFRVSTPKQGRSGLGLGDQRARVQQFIAERGGMIAPPEYVEVESGKDSERPELQKALKRCRLTGSTLVVAKLDRLSRNAAFLMTLRDSGVNFIAADLPEANTMTVGMMAIFAQHEAECISARTKAALAVAKARGVVLGGYREKAPSIKKHQKAGVRAWKAKADKLAEDRRELLESFKNEGLSMNAMARRLNELGIETPRKATWTATAVRNAMARL